VIPDSKKYGSAAALGGLTLVLNAFSGLMAYAAVSNWKDLGKNSNGIIEKAREKIKAYRENRKYEPEKHDE